MRLSGKSIEKVEAQDIIYLKDNKVPEDVSLEYKSELPGNADGEKKEFLADVSAFANRYGGMIIYGIEEERDENSQPTGFLKDICGLGILNQDKEKQRLEQIVSAGLDPKLSNVVFRFTEIDEKLVLLFGIPRSLFAPHVVWFQRNGKFYIRTNTGKEQMDVHELRRAFLQRSDWETQADSFRRQRIMDVQYQGWIPTLDSDNSYFIHILPLGADRAHINLKLAESRVGSFALMPYQTFRTSYNIDGLLQSFGSPIKAYIQYFRNGGLEFFVSTPRFQKQFNDKKVWMLKGETIEKYSVHVLKKYLAFAEELSIQPPFEVFLSLIGTSDKYIVVDPDYYDTIEELYKRFDRNQILLPGLVLENIMTNPEDFLAPSFDILWQAGGWNESPF